MNLFQKTLFLYLFFSNISCSYAQKGVSKLDKETKEVLSVIFPKMKLKVSETVAQWDSADYESVMDCVYGEDYQAYCDSVKNIVNEIFADNSFSTITSYNQRKWQSISLPNKFKILQETDYQIEAKKQRQPVSLKYTKICAMSSPLFTKDFQKVLIKMDYLQSYLSSNGCEYSYVICQKIKERWILVGGMGRNCIFE